MFLFPCKEYSETLEFLLQVPESFCQELPMGPMVMDVRRARRRSPQGGKS